MNISFSAISNGFSHAHIAEKNHDCGNQRCFKVVT